MLDPVVVLPLVLGCLGAIVGSFLNVVIYRLPREDLTVLKPRRSLCPKCQRSLPWYENVPILGWIFLGGRCRGCKASIPLRYLIVEILNAGLWGAFGAVVMTNPAVDFETVGGFLELTLLLLSGMFLTSTCIVVTYIDIDYKIIPDEITWSGMILGLILSVAAPILQLPSVMYYKLVGNSGMERHLAAGLSSGSGLLVGIGLVLLVGWLGSKAFRKEAMGLGDVKYMGMVGAFLGFDGVLLVFFLGCMAGAVGGLIHRALTGSRYIAFGPYLALGVLLVLFFRNPILEFCLVTWPMTFRHMIGLDG